MRISLRQLKQLIREQVEETLTPADPDRDARRYMSLDQMLVNLKDAEKSGKMSSEDLEELKSFIWEKLPKNFDLGT